MGIILWSKIWFSFPQSGYQNKQAKTQAQTSPFPITINLAIRYFPEAYKLKVN